MAEIKNINPFTKNLLNRFFGGSASQTDPYVSGFFLLQFTHLPTTMIGDSHAGDVLTAVATSVTLPDYAIDAVTVNALGGLKFKVPGALTLGDEMTIVFTEYQYLPVFNVIRNWHYGIRNNILGYSNHSVLSHKNYVQTNYKGNILVVYLRPNMEEIEFAGYASGVWPLNVPVDSMNSDINEVAKKDHSIRFSVDLFHLEDWVMDKAAKFVSAVRSNTTDEYLMNKDNTDHGGNTK